jgi:hypothetical protein
VSGLSRLSLQCNREVELRQGGYTFRWQGLTFVNSPQRVLWTEPRKDIWLDLDGTLSGSTNGWVTPYYAWNDLRPNCVHADYVYDFGIVCDNTVTIRRLKVDNVRPTELNFLVRTHCVPCSRQWCACRIGVRVTCRCCVCACVRAENDPGRRQRKR